MENNNNNIPGLAGLRKGAWTKEEDDLLRQCIDKYGEGKWHLVPLRAGLNRCRKSCRLRWLNYLRPNIKRGCFDQDEIDLILRLHKLLGNRWSLIAGRIPGRTANDVKNFWNTLVGKKANHNNNNNNNLAAAEGTSNKNMDLSCGAIIIKDEVIKSRPRTFLSKRPHHHHDHAPPPPLIISSNNNLMESCEANESSSLVETSSSQQQQQQMLQDESIRWWTSLLEEAAMDDRHLHYYNHHEEEEEDDDGDDELVLDKTLWPGPYGDIDHNELSSDILNNVDDDVDIWGGIIGGL